MWAHHEILSINCFVVIWMIVILVNVPDLNLSSLKSESFSTSHKWFTPVFVIWFLLRFSSLRCDGFDFRAEVRIRLCFSVILHLYRLKTEKENTINQICQDRNLSDPVSLTRSVWKGARIEFWPICLEWVTIYGSDGETKRVVLLGLGAGPGLRHIWPCHWQCAQGALGAFWVLWGLSGAFRGHFEPLCPQSSPVQSRVYGQITNLSPLFLSPPRLYLLISVSL